MAISSAKSLTAAYYQSCSDQPTHYRFLMQQHSAASADITALHSNACKTVSWAIKVEDKSSNKRWNDVSCRMQAETEERFESVNFSQNPKTLLSSFKKGNHMVQWRTKANYSFLLLYYYLLLYFSLQHLNMCSDYANKKKLF